MLKLILVSFVSFFALFGDGSDSLFSKVVPSAKSDSGTLEKMIVSSGVVVMDIDVNRLSGGESARVEVPASLRFDAENETFFTIQVFNGELRGALPSALPIIPRTSTVLPAKLSDSYGRLVVEHLPWGRHFDLVVRDSQTGFIFFDIDGYESLYDPSARQLNLKGGRLLISTEFAAELGRAADAGTIVGQIDVTATMRAIEVSQLVDGETSSAVLPAGAGMSPDAGAVPGPDVIVGDVNGLSQFGSASNGYVGLALGTDSCNAGVVDLNWFALPSNDHPVIPQNMYRMSGGPNNNERFEQIGQSSVKHGFTALRDNICNLGCNGVGGTRLGSGCSDPYSASLNSGPSLGSRAWINPFTGVFPRGDSATPPNSHSGHNHPGPSHRILTKVEDLNTSANAGATYFAEGQYVTPHEYSWCQSNPTQCNMNNNVSYRRYNVFGAASPFSFSPASPTVRQKAAIDAWTGATLVEFQPDPVNDGIGIVGYKVTNPSPGVWHYEYAVYNQNLDRSIQSFTVPVGAGTTITNVGFSGPPQHPAWVGDGTVGNAGFSSSAWTHSLGSGTLTWNSETFAQNPNANAIRWGTLYNFRFDSNAPPAGNSGTVGFFKTGGPVAVRIESPASTNAGVEISGRVLTPSGIGIRSVIVTMTDSQGVKRTATTNSFGIYTFGNVGTGSGYVIAAASKRYRFQSRVLDVTAGLSDLDLIGLE